MLTISITGFSADPDDITRVLGIEPTRVRRLTDPGPRRFNAWWLDVHPEPLWGGADHARGMLALREVLKGRSDQFGAVADGFRPETMTVYGGLYKERHEQCGIWLEPDDMALLAACRLGWGLDVFTDDRSAQVKT